MMPEILTESFCERCGTRYTFEATAPAKVKKLGRFKTLSKGLKNYVLSDENSLDEAMAAARSDEERDMTSQQLEAFQATFNFCMTCRQYTCANCWNAAEGACLTCAPLNGQTVVPPAFLDLAPLVPTEQLHAQPSAWPISDVSREAALAASAEAAPPSAETAPTHDEANGADGARFTALVAADASADHVGAAASAWPIEAEQAANPDALLAIVAEPDGVVAGPEAEAEQTVAVPELSAQPEADDWAKAEAEASVEAQPSRAAHLDAVVSPELAPEEAEPEPEVAALASEPEITATDTYVFETDIAPAVAELPADGDLRAAAAARRTSELLARLRPAAGTEPDQLADEAPADPIAAAPPLQTEDPIAEWVAEAPSSPIDDAIPEHAAFAADEFVVADNADAEPALEELVAFAPWPEEPVVGLPTELLAVIGPPIEAAPEPVVENVAEALEVPADAETTRDEATPELADVEGAEAAVEPEPELATAEPALAAVEPEPEPETAHADVVEQPTWRIVAPDVVALPTNGHTPHAEPAQPAVVAESPVVSAPAVEPQWPTPPQSPVLDADPSFLVSRRTTEASTGQWAAAPKALPAAPSAPIIGVQTCGSCGLSLSATARFCRRCGTRQGD